MTFGEKVQTLRKERGLSQTEFGKLVGVSPVSYTHLTLPTILRV